MRRTALVVGICGIVAAAVLGVFFFASPAGTVQAQSYPMLDRYSSGPLDGLTFASDLGHDGEAPHVADKLVFDNGMFVSTECEARCNYPASPYFVRPRGEALEFISETRCPYKDATIVWRGTIENGRIKGESTWTMKRWYWTVERTFWFEGELTEHVAAIDG